MNWKTEKQSTKRFRETVLSNDRWNWYPSSKTGKEKRKVHITNIKNERGVITTDPTEILKGL